MRKLWKIFLLAGVLCAILCVGTLAAEADTSGVYDVKTSTGYTLTPQTADQETITPTPVTINGGSQNLYANAERFTLTGPSTNGNQYLVLALSGTDSTPTESNIVYIDQTGATGTTVTFNVYPSALTSGATYNVYMVGTGEGESYKKVASFTYYAPYVLGDCDGEKGIDIRDATAMLNHIVMNKLLEGNNLIAADVTKDGKVDINDVSRLLNYIVQNIDSLD